jgi:prepilin-type N-terminal cleavage/methylation domain-containing protein
MTLIELMVVVVIVGLLAAIAGPQLAHSRERAYVTAMITSLRNVAAAEDSYFYDFATYSPNAADLQARGVELRRDVTLSINEATSSGWSATATHVATPVKCSMFIGSAAPVGAASAEGVVACS